MPLLHLLAGPNGSGKTTFYEHVLGAVTALAFINADVIAREHWPHATKDYSYQAAKIAAQRRDELIRSRQSFIAATVFSHPSKLELIRNAQCGGYLVVVHVMLSPLALSLRRGARPAWWARCSAGKAARAFCAALATRRRSPAAVRPGLCL